VQKIIHFILVVLLSSVKFIGGPILVYFNQKYEPEFGFIGANFACIIGGMLGVFVFLYLSKFILRIYRKLRASYFHVFKKKQIFSEPVVDVSAPVKVQYDYILTNHPKKRIFTPRNRRIIRIWQTYGLIGLAALTPILFSIPIGTFIMTRFESNNKRILFYMFVSITCWSLLLTTFFELTQIKNIEEIVK
jgi:hypothetical protein